MMGRHQPYARRCLACGHATSQHRWNVRDGGSLTAGPYRCLQCECEQPQDMPSVPMSEAEFRESKRRRQASLSGSSPTPTPEETP